MTTNSLSVQIGQYSSPGRKALNQDFHGALIPDEPQLSSKGIALALADGISSSDVSHQASEMAVTGFLQDYYCTSEAWSVKTAAQQVLKATNSWLYAQTRNSPYRYNKDRGYVCTFSGMVIKSNTAHLFHCGDSRIYRLSGNSLEQLTKDHRRQIDSQTSYLARALGIQDVLDLDYRSESLSVGDTFVLTTDGVHEFVSERTIAETLNLSAETESSSEETAGDSAGLTALDAVAQHLVELAYARGSSDNLTIQVVRINQLPPRHIEELQQHLTELPPAPLLSARATLDGYRIIRDLHAGSRSHVYLAEDLDTKALVALKVPSTEGRQDATYLNSLLMEEWIARRINNAHVLKAIDPKVPRSCLYTIMEYVPGQTLEQWMHDNPQPDLETVRSILTQIGKGLRAFHRQEMVHQDLRPHNVMIDAQGNIKIIDFGATKVAGLSELAPRNEGLVGTAQFSAPEYFLGESGTAQSDLFSLGVVAYKLLSGELPYGNEVARTRTRRAQGRLNYQRLSTAHNPVPIWIDYAIEKATEINPLKRHQEVAEFIHEITQPNPAYLSKARPPLVERDPVRFWQGISLILLVLVIYLAIPD